MKKKLISVLAALFLGSSAGWGATTMSVAEPAIELPTYVVSDTRDLPPPESWRYAEIPGFAILSNASDRETQRIIGDFETFRQALGIVWPMPTKTSLPISIILCGTRGKFDAFIPVGKTRPDSGMASMLMKAGERVALVVDLQVSSLDIADTALHIADAKGRVVDSSAGFDVDHNKLLYREYVHYLLSRFEPRQPAWMEEAVMQLIMAMRVNRSQIVFAEVESGQTISSQQALLNRMNADLEGTLQAEDPLPDSAVEDTDFPGSLGRARLLPLDKLFSVAHEAPETLNPIGNNTWAKQCYAFVHMCLYGQGGRYQKQFGQFLQRASREPVTEAMFQECFGMDYRHMLDELQGYIRFTDHQSREYRFKKGKELPVPPPLALREAEEFESGRIVGDALMLGGHVEAAGKALITPYLRGDRDPQLLASLGIYERAVGHDERARKFLTKAVAGNVTRPEAYLELARLRYADALAKPDAGQAFSLAQIAGITELLYVARHQPPHLLELYQLLAETWARSAAKITRDDALVLVQGAMLFPQKLKLTYQAAVFAADAGVLEAAHGLANRGVEGAREPETKARFQELKSSLPPLGSTR